MTEPSIEWDATLVKRLCTQRGEPEWLEFKHNKANPEEIGEYISALSNSAALEGRANGYVVWGVEDETHDIVGTAFSPSTVKVGNEELENWLLRLLTPKIGFRFVHLVVDTKPMVLLVVDRALRQPVAFKGREFVRVGSYKKPLKDLPDRERQLWRIFDAKPFEDLPAKERVADSEVLRLLDYAAYFRLLGQPEPTDSRAILGALSADRLIQQSDAGDWVVTNLGAILFANELKDFRSVARNAVRVIQYQGDSRVQTIAEQTSAQGYGCGFESLVAHINSVLPTNEVIEQALRRTVPMFPELAVRELVANALIHQDLAITGAGPMIEIFDGRMEISNPGTPLIDTDRFLDSPPQSRNEALASLLRRMGVCEERGSGIDKVVFQTELFQLPAPKFIATDDATRTILFAHRPLSDMDREDRVRACYLHACLRYVNGEYMTNASLRDRFGIERHNSAIASRIIRDALEARAVKTFDESAGKKFRKYIPKWA